MSVWRIRTGPDAGRRVAAGRMMALARAGLVLVGLGNAEVGVWGEASPRSFYSSFPGFGHHWVSAMGAYDEHLVRDYAAAELGLALLLVCAAIWFERRLVVVGGFAFLAATLPHFAYHLTTTKMLSTADNVSSLGSFVVEMGVVALAMRVAWQLPHDTETERNP